jgi:orotate phosphoribosyltransferase-like protein
LRDTPDRRLAIVDDTICTGATTATSIKHVKRSGYGAKAVKTESTGMDTARLMKAKQAQEFFYLRTITA